MDYGVYDKQNIPITRHNQKLFTLYRTQVNFSDFASFVSVDVQDVVNNKDKKGFVKTQQDVDNYEQLKVIDQDTVFSKAQLRQYLARYLPERMMWTGIHPVYNDTMERDTHRYYWASKMAKDFVIATGKESFKGSEIDHFF